VDPRSRVLREARAAPGIESLRGFEEPHVAVLDQVQEVTARLPVLERDRDDEPQIVGHETHLRVAIPGVRPTPQLGFLVARQQCIPGDLLGVAREEIGVTGSDSG
jgi:hypothetical protein